MVNLRLGYRFKTRDSGQYDIGFYGKNVTDEKYRTVDFGRQSNTLMIGDPITVGIELKARFGEN